MGWKLPSPEEAQTIPGEFENVVPARSAKPLPQIVKGPAGAFTTGKAKTSVVIPFPGVIVLEQPSGVAAVTVISSLSFNAAVYCAMVPGPCTEAPFLKNSYVLVLDELLGVAVMVTSCPAQIWLSGSELLSVTPKFVLVSVPCEMLFAILFPG